MYGTDAGTSDTAARCLMELQWRFDVKREFKASLLPVLAACLYASSAQAEVSFHGFGQTVVGTTLSSDRKVPAVPSYEADADFKPETLFALQASAPLAQGISATAQVLSSGAQDFQAKFQWAYLSWQADSHWRITAGRQVLPFYQYSDYLQVGQAYPWIRPPVSVYNLSASAFEGLTVASGWQVGDWNLRPQALAGRFKGEVTYLGTTLNSEYKNIVGLILDSTYDDWLTLRAAAFTSSIYGTFKDPTTQANFDGLTSLLRSSGLSTAADELETDDDPGVFVDLAMGIDKAGWVFNAEYTTARAMHSITARSKQYYVSGGHRFGKWLPLLTWGRTNSKTSDCGALDSIPAANPFYPVVASVINDPSLNRQDHYYEFGVRYDVRPNIALKLDYTGFQSAVSGVSSANLLSAGVTFTF